jgi:hypothetical protein
MVNYLYQALLLIEVDAPTRERVLELSSLDGYVWQFARQPFNAIMWYPEPLPDGITYVATPEAEMYGSTLGVLNAWLTNACHDWQKFRLILEPRELASLWHLPYRGFTAPTIAWLSGRQTPLPVQLKENCQDVCLGENCYAGQSTAVFMRNANRAEHMIIFGKTGMGKSTLLHNLVHQDIAQGRGVAVVDPHGNLVRDILRVSIPPEREKDVVVWDLADTQYPPPLNLLAVPVQYDRAQAITQVMGIFEKIYGDFGTTRMAYTLSMALSTLLADETPTLLDVGRLFRDDAYRWKLVDKLDNPDIEAFWEDFERRTLRDQDELVLPILRRLNAFTGSPVLRPILCHPQNLDVASLIGQDKIILISLQEAEGMQLPPHSQRLLGAVLVSQFQLSVRAGAARRQSYLYIDEAQNFVTTAIPEIFNEARKRNLSLTLSNQFLRQLTGDTMDAIMGNVGAMVVFQCGEPDARAVASYMKPNFAVDDLVQLDKYQASVFMRFETQQLPAFSLNTRPAPGSQGSSVAAEAEERIRRLSRECYTPETREEVAAWLEARYPRKKRPPYTGTEDDFSEPVK